MRPLLLDDTRSCAFADRPGLSGKTVTERKISVGEKVDLVIGSAHGGIVREAVGEGRTGRQRVVAGGTTAKAGKVFTYHQLQTVISIL
jgi:hypothetical protein